MLLRIGSIAAAFFFCVLPALPCSCGGGNPGSCQVPAADLIVRATVIAKEVNQTRPPFAPPRSGGALQPASRSAGAIPQPEPWGNVMVTLSVSERFRGAIGDSLIVKTEPGETACGYPFEVGHEYLVFANEFQGSLTVTTCSATQPAKMAVARILQLRALRDGTALPDIFGFVSTHPLRSDQSGLDQVQPVPGLTVTAQSDAAEYRVQTGDDGLYAFRGMPVGRYQLSVEAPPGRRAFWGGGAEHPGASPGVGCAMNFEIFWDGRIRGTVIGSDGQAATGFVTAQYTGPETEPAGSFGVQVKEGNFEIVRLPPGRYRLGFSAVVAGRLAGTTVYYPGTRIQSAASLIEVGEGAHIDGLLFHVF